MGLYSLSIVSMVRKKALEYEAIHE